MEIPESESDSLLMLLSATLMLLLVLLLAALVLEVDDTFLLGGGVFLAGTLASGLLDGLLPPLSVPEIVHNKVGDLRVMKSKPVEVG
jgi:hypothetical protein